MLPKILKKPRLIYLDHAATTPLDPRVERVMRPFWSKIFANPSSLHANAKLAKDALENSRQIIARIIQAKKSEVIFTAGGTESVNLAILGVCRAYQKRTGKPGHIVTSAIEHEAVLKACRALESQGWQLTIVPVDQAGVVSFEKLKKAIKSNTVLVSVMYANNEVGTVQPITKIAHYIKNLKSKNSKQETIFHTDACQAAGALDLNVQKLGVDLLSANGSKVYGPKQIGFLFARSGVNLEPVIFGGGQERDLRSGTENVPAVVGLAESLALAQKNATKENQRLFNLRNYLQKNLLTKISPSVLNGIDDSREVGNYKRLPNNLNISFPGIDGEALVIYLDSYGIAVSTGSACTTQNPDPSHVLMAMGKTKSEAEGSIRFTLGKSTTKKDLDYVIKVLPSLVKSLKSL